MGLKINYLIHFLSVLNLLTALGMNLNHSSAASLAHLMKYISPALLQPQPSSFGRSSIHFLRYLIGAVSYEFLHIAVFAEPLLMFQTQANDMISTLYSHNTPFDDTVKLE